MKRFDGKVALITGAGSGMGRSITLRLAAEGASVFAVDVDPVGLAATASMAPAAVVVREGDIADPVTCAQVVAQCAERFGRLHVLGNVAGIFRAAHATDITRGVPPGPGGEPRRAVLPRPAAIPHLSRSTATSEHRSNAGIQGVPYAAA